MSSTISDVVVVVVFPDEILKGKKIELMELGKCNQAPFNLY
ncbi:hypothetical protein [Bacillus sp. S3]|nr:hypothetical protein [Bacillus sp. S3]